MLRLISGVKSLRTVICVSCRLQNGTTYNSYVIFGADKTALVDASHEKFGDLYTSHLREQLAAAGRSLDYIFVSHTEPDHSGANLCCAFRMFISLSLPGSTLLNSTI